MAKDNGSSSIFDLAGKQPRKPIKKTTVPPTEPAQKQRESSKEPNISSEQVTESIDKMKRLHTELQSKLEELYKKVGLTPKQVEAFLEGLSPAEKELMSKDTATLEKQVWEALGSEAKSLQKKKEEDKKIQKRKTKSGYHKGWIPTK